MTLSPTKNYEIIGFSPPRLWPLHPPPMNTSSGHAPCWTGRPDQVHKACDARLLTRHAYKVFELRIDLSSLLKYEMTVNLAVSEEL